MIRLNRKFTAASIAAGLLISAIVIHAQSRGTPSQIRVNIDANGAIVTAAALQSSPVTQQLFSNARLAVDASGNLLTVISGGSGIISGSLAITQVPFGSGTDTIAGDAKLFWNNTAKQFTSGINQDNAAFDNDIEDWWGREGIINSGGVITGNATSISNQVQGTGFVNGMASLAMTTSVSGTSNVLAMNLDAIAKSTVSAQRAIGIDAATGNFGAGTLIDAIQVLADGLLGNGATTGTITNAVGFNAAYQGAPAGGTVTNSYGLLIDDQAGGATNAWAIKTGTGLVDFGDDIRIATGKAIKTDTTTAHTLLISGYDVNGTAYVPFVTVTNANAPTFAVAPSGDGLVNITTTLLTSSGSGLAVANVGANSCGSTAAAIAGNSNSFEITVGTVAGTQCRVTFPTAAPVRWNCVANNTTTANLARATAIDTTHVDFSGTFVAGDVVSGTCTPR